jgi:hypothetical protein
MTTRVVVDAHAGWPVKVVQIGNPDSSAESRTEVIVDPYTQRVFHVWHGRDLLIQEQPVRVEKVEPFASRRSSRSRREGRAGRVEKVEPLGVDP